MSKYQIWDKKSNVITPIGEVLSAEEWSDRYPMSKIDGVDLVIGGGVINGGICQEYTSFVEIFRDKIDVDSYSTRQEVLDAIADYEQTESERLREEEAARAAAITPEERIAAALEAQVLLSMPDVEE